jgi:hypothetical protein
VRTAREGGHSQATLHHDRASQLTVHPLEGDTTIQRILGHESVKRDVINMLDRSRTASVAGVKYQDTSLGNKRFDRIVAEIAETVRIPNKALHGTENCGRFSVP